MLMPFGKRLPALAAESESKQSCVIFSFYFMSLATAMLHDGRGVFANSSFLCIILITFMNITHRRPAHVYFPCIRRPFLW